MKSYRIQHHAADNPEDDSYAYKSHTSEDRENMLEVQKQGWEPPVWLDVTRQVITPLVFVAQLITSDLNQISRTGEGIAGAFALDSDAATALEPSPSWFCIWAFIYSGLAFYSVYQAVPEQRQSILCRAVGWEVAAALALQAFWGGVASTAEDAAVPLVQLELEGLMLLLFLLLLKVMWELAYFERAMSTFDQALVVFPLSLWAGWITGAAFLNTASLIRVCGAKSLEYDRPDQMACVIFIAVAALIAGSLIVYFKGCPWYTVSVLWGFLGIAVTSSRPGARYIGAASGLAVVGLILACYWTLWNSSEHSRWGVVSKRMHQFRMTWDSLSTEPKQEGVPIAKGVRGDGVSQYGAVDGESSPSAEAAGADGRDPEKEA